MRSDHAARTIKAAALICIVCLVGACNPGTVSGPETRTGASVQAAASSAPAADLPATGQLSLALLNADELGPAFTQKPTASPSPSRPENGKDSRFKGCQPLARLLNADDEHPTYPGATATFASNGLATVFEALTAEPPDVLNAEYGQAKKALEACDSIVLVTAGQTIKFSLTPIRFGGPDSSAVRMDARHRGVLINGYIAIEQLSQSVALTFSFFQVGGGSSQLASAFYQRAADKARTALNLQPS
ncbi:hypothetical protein ACFW93_49250 [Streptomyces canus]|uniref:hypothetical protein n=1 Tax=Streptomyces canus TaxID=58343 RepID=UPI003674315D